MNNWQEWVVWVLVALCATRVIYGLSLFFRRTQENHHPCDTCVTGCDLKDIMSKQHSGCCSPQKSTKKKCCG